MKNEFLFVGYTVSFLNNYKLWKYEMGINTIEYGIWRKDCCFR